MGLTEDTLRLLGFRANETGRPGRSSRMIQYGEHRPEFDDRVGPQVASASLLPHLPIENCSRAKRNQRSQQPKASF
jgi:hypothetical protein